MDSHSCIWVRCNIKQYYIGCMLVTVYKNLLEGAAVLVLVSVTYDRVAAVMFTTNS